MTLGPLHLAVVTVPKPWGGRRLADLGRDLPAGTLIGESWEVADLDPATTGVADPVTRVAAGPHRGAALVDLIASHGPDLLGTAAAIAGRFPLLVKLLDAREPLSIQVHPPEADVARDPQSRPKSESWVVLDADPGAELMIGLADGVTYDQLAQAAGTSRVVPLLARRPAVPGAVHHVPAGTIHALGAGVLVAEVQTPSDTTYRLYDWTDELGRAPRDLDTEAALAAISAAWGDNVAPPPPVDGDAAVIETPHYRLRRWEVRSGVERASAAGSLRVLLVLDGDLDGAGFDRTLERGSCVVLPATCATTLTARTSTTVLEVELP